MHVAFVSSTLRCIRVHLLHCFVAYQAMEKNHQDAMRKLNETLEKEREVSVALGMNQICVGVNV